MKLDAEVIQKELRRTVRDGAVASYRVETGTDASGHDAVWVYTMLRKKLDVQRRARLRDKVRETVRKRLTGGVRQGWLFREEPWVYIRFRGASEHVDDSAA
jgi:hypothetical protein